MNFELMVSVMSGVGGGLGVIIPVFVAWRKDRQRNQDEFKSWQNTITQQMGKVTETLDSVVNTQKEQTTIISRHSEQLKDREANCRFNHEAIKKQFDTIESKVNDYTTMIREIIAPMKDMQEELHIVANDVTHIKELFNEKFRNFGLEIADLKKTRNKT